MAKQKGWCEKIRVNKFDKPKLRDGSFVTSYKRIEVGSIPGKAKILIAEGVTNTGKSVLLTEGTPQYIPSAGTTYA